MLRSALALLTAAGLMLAGPVAGADCRYQDVPAAHPAHVAVAAVCERGIMVGFGGYFRGERVVKRFQLALVGKKLLDEIARGGPRSTSTGELPPDVPANHWAARSVSRALEAGLMRADPGFLGAGGRPKFLGARVVSGAELRVLLDRARSLAGLPASSAPPPDPTRPVTRFDVATWVAELLREAAPAQDSSAVSGPSEGSHLDRDPSQRATQAMLVELADEHALLTVKVQTLEEKVATLEQQLTRLRQATGKALRKIMAEVRKDG